MKNSIKYLVTSIKKARGAKRRAGSGQATLAGQARYLLLDTHKAISTIEMVMWITMLGIISVAIMSMTNYIYKRNRDVLAESVGALSGRRASERIVRDLREANFGQDGAYPIVSFGPNDIVFYSDTDRDDTLERVHYYLTGTILNRGVVNPSGNPPTYSTGNELITMMTDKVINTSQSVPLFAFYDSSGVAITDYTQIGKVAYIVIRVVVNRAPFNQTRVTEIRSSVSMRNYLGI
jgi:hypothetical protein